MLRSFKPLEHWEGGENALRGARGPVHVTRIPKGTVATKNFLNALSRVASVPQLKDYNGNEQEGVGLSQQSTYNGQSYSAAKAYLADAPGTLEIRTGILVNRVVIEGGRAVGVEILAGNETKIIRAGRELVVSSGAYGSSQVLMRSGIGPAAHLSTLV